MNKIINKIELNRTKSQGGNKHAVKTRMGDGRLQYEQKGGMNPSTKGYKKIGALCATDMTIQRYVSKYL